MTQLFAERAAEATGLSPANIAFLVDVTDVMSSISSSVLGFRSAADMGFKLGIDVLTGGPLRLTTYVA